MEFASVDFKRDGEGRKVDPSPKTLRASSRELRVECRAEMELGGETDVES